MEAVLQFIQEEREPIFAVVLFLFIFGVYRLFMYEMRRKDREKEKNQPPRFPLPYEIKPKDEQKGKNRNSPFL